VRVVFEHTPGSGAGVEWVGEGMDWVREVVEGVEGREG
jgi:hypothetical protein